MALTFQSPHNWSLDESWRARASCNDVDPDLFFPVGVTGPAVAQIAAAKAVCAGCSVRDECLEFAISTNQEYGIWGGTSEEERRVLRRAWRARQRRAAS
jgi:WhiB family transcriptional regulator, redox-sensing transcriptional regulator